jgi:hypothetical protein
MGQLCNVTHLTSEVIIPGTQIKKLITILKQDNFKKLPPPIYIAEFSLYMEEQSFIYRI